MPSSETEKTKLAPRKWTLRTCSWVIAIFLIVSFVGGLVLAGSYKRTLAVNQKTYQLEEVTDEAEQIKGLSGRDRLGPHDGMLFSYPEEKERCFWMKDMRFSLDIIWFDKNKRIVRVERSVPPRTYPETFCATAQYVIELPAGEAAKQHLNPGRVLTF